MSMTILAVYRVVQPFSYACQTFTWGKAQFPKQIETLLGSKTSQKQDIFVICGIRIRAIIGRPEGGQLPANWAVNSASPLAHERRF
jgi:hypothetical protein